METKEKKGEDKEILRLNVVRYWIKDFRSIV